MLEQRPSAGGRSSSFRDSTTGDVVDNGQHVLIAGYHRTMEFLQVIGSRSLLKIQSRPDLLFHHPVKGFRRFSVPPLPSPLHFCGALLGSNLFSPSDRFRLLRAGLSLTRHDPVETNDMTVSEWLDRNGQSREARRSFWDPLAVSIMNDLPQLAAASPFLSSLRETFLGPWSDACVAIPTVPLTDLYVRNAVGFIHSRGGEVRCSQDVRNLHMEGEQIRGVLMRDGTTLDARSFILSVPPYRLSDLLPLDAGTGIDVHSLQQASYSPIVSTHLWFNEEFMIQPFVGLIGRQTQWVFNRRRIEGNHAAGSHISTVTSAAYDLVDRSNEEIINGCLDDLRTVFGSRVGRPYHAVVVRERRATVSLTPAMERARPSQKTAAPNLFLAGDWTRTGLPATIEGAVRSGESAAEHAAGYLDTTSPPV